MCHSRRQYELSNVTGIINQTKEESVNDVITLLHNLLIYLRDTRNICSFECSSILFGALTKEMRALHLFNTTPLLSFSFAEIVSHARNMRSPEWITTRRDRYYDQYYETHSCSISSYIDPVLNDLESTLTGLNLEDIHPEES